MHKNLIHAVIVGFIATLSLSFITQAQPPGGGPPQQQGPTSAGGWTDDGVVVRLTSSTDFVGIGTANPQSKLEIQGRNLVIGGNATSTITGNLSEDSIIGGSLIIHQGQALFLTDSQGTSLGFVDGGNQIQIGLETPTTTIRIFPPAGGGGGVDIGFSNLNPSQIYQISFPNQSGRFMLDIGTTPTVSCFAMQDSDGVGVTYVTANDGILTATTTKPNICQ